MPKQKTKKPYLRKAKVNKKKVSSSKWSLLFTKPVLFVLFFALVGTYFLWRSFAAVLLVGSIQAESLTPAPGVTIITDTAADQGAALHYTSNATASGQSTLSSAATQITVRAKGVQCSGAPQMTIAIDGVQVQSVAVSATTWTDYTANASITSGAHTVSASFTNDYVSNKGKASKRCNRDLYIDKISFYGQSQDPLPPPTPVGSEGICSGRDANGGVPADKFPGAACTGVPAGVTLQDIYPNYGTYYVVSVDGTVLDAKNIRGHLCISANNVTVKRSRSVGAIALGCDDGTRPTNLTLEDYEMDGQNDGADGIAYFPSVTCRRCNIHDVSKGITGEGITLIDSWIHDLYGEGYDPATWSHNETLLLSGTNPTVIKHNNLDGRFSAASAGAGGMSATIAIYSHGHWGPVDNITIDGNYISGGGVYCVYGGMSDDYTPTNIKYINNIFEYPPKCDSPVTGFYNGNNNVWSNNKYTNGSPVNN